MLDFLVCQAAKPELWQIPTLLFFLKSEVMKTNKNIQTHNFDEYDSENIARKEELTCWLSINIKVS